MGKIKRYISSNWKVSLQRRAEFTRFKYKKEWEHFSRLKKRALLLKELMKGIGIVRIPHIDLCVTSRCSLKCKYCTQWNPYIDNATVYQAQSIISIMDKLLSVIDYLERVAIIGGEAFLNKELGEIIEYLVSQKKIGWICVITNGTIIPDEKTIQSLKHEKVEVWIDKYRNNSKKADELKRILEEKKVQVWFDPIDRWFDFGLLSKKYEEKQQIVKNFESCYLRDCCGLYDGKLYRCCRTWVLENNKLEIPREYECIDIEKIKNKGQMWKALFEFYGLSCVQACAWCNKKEDRKEIPTAEQIILK